MWLVLQISLGVFLGLWLFRYVMTRPPRQPRDWTRLAIGVMSTGLIALWVLHLLLTVPR